MKKLIKKKIILTLFACLLATSCSTTHRVSSSIGQDHSFDSNFLSLFHDAEEIGHEKTSGNYLISDEVKRYFGACCRYDKETILSLLKANGFSMTDQVKTCEPTRLDESREQAKKIENKCDTSKIINSEIYRGKDFDEIYVGERRAYLRPFVWKTYRIILYVKEEKAQKVTANSYIEGL